MVSCQSPLVQFGVDDVLGLVGAGAGREGYEVGHKLTGHAPQELVGRGQRLPCAGGTHTQQLRRG